jgi:hypothetical protein
MVQVNVSTPNHYVWLNACCTDEEHAQKVFQAWLAGLEVTRRPIEFKVLITPVGR